MSMYGFNIHKWKQFATAIAIVIVPMLFIVAQRETGSALVYLSFFLMFYREGMPGSFLFTGVAMIVYFVIGIKYEEVIDRKSTRLNSSHANISYAVFCLKKKNKKIP